MKWEYKAPKIIAETHISLYKLLNDFGEDGWELVHCDLNVNVFIFKRPIPNIKLELELTEEQRRMIGHTVLVAKND